MPGGCDPSTGVDCPPPPPKCDPAADPICVCDAAGNCWDDPCADPTDPNCMPPPSCPNPDASGACPPACEDPNDPTTCKDPCMIDPMSCGCASDDPNCWPPPCDPKTDPMCDPSGGTMAPDHPPFDFGCEDGG
jgi:hypothetical protein